MVSGRDFLGPYRLIRLIRAGTHTQVWEALKDGTRERLALKVLSREHIKNREEISQLKHEAAVGVPLKHRNIVDIYEYNSEFELPFVAMELFFSRNLKQDLREQSDRTAHLSTEIIKQAALALEHLHLRGWVHCDVKPDNFLVKDDGTLKLIDFSIAMKLNKKVGGFFSKGKVKGTRSYMSPEQIRGKSLGATADVYSLGCVVFEILGGRTPYTADNPNELLQKHLNASIPTMAPLNPAITPEVVDLVQRMMAKTAKDRPKDMRAFLKEFENLRVYKTGMKPRPPSEIEDEDENAGQ